MNRRGFTLLEVLVTMVVAAMFSVAVYAIFIRTLVDTDYLEQQSMCWRTGQSILRLLEKDLSGCPAGSGSEQLFSGGLSMSESASLAFVTAVDGRALVANETFNDVINVAYEVEEAELEAEGMSLFRIETTGGNASTPGVDTRRRLARGVSMFSLEYHDGNDWTGQWQGSGPPRAVRVKLVLTRRLQVSPEMPARDFEFPFNTVVQIPAGG